VNTNIDSRTGKPKIIIDACGGTGSWSKPYKDAGYDVRLITLPEYNIFSIELGWQKGIRVIVLKSHIFGYKTIQCKSVYGILAAPTCTKFSFCRTNAKEPRNLDKAMELVNKCLEIIYWCQYDLPSTYSKKTTLKFWALENPKGFLQSFLGNPPLEFSPYEYGDNYKKCTQIWGNFNIPVKNPISCSTNKFDKTLLKDLPQLPSDYTYQKGCGLDVRQVRRSITPAGFAQAFYKANK
jgi:hypothetical protein